MAVVIFDGTGPGTGDSDYLDWVASHPEGYVLSSSRPADASKIKLHRPSCPHVTQTQGSNPPGEFTERQYSKVCGDTKAELEAWAAGLGGPGPDYPGGCHCLRSTP